MIWRPITGTVLYGPFRYRKRRKAEKHAFVGSKPRCVRPLAWSDQRRAVRPESIDVAIMRDIDREMDEIERALAYEAKIGAATGIDLPPLLKAVLMWSVVASVLLIVAYLFF